MIVLVLVTTFWSVGEGAPAAEEFEAQVIPLPGAAYYGAVRAALAGAKESILCAMYIADFDPKRPEDNQSALVMDLVAAHNRGVRVAVVLDLYETAGHGSARKGSVDKKNEETFLYLKKKGVNVIYDSGTTTLHSKLIVIDDEVTIVGSANWTYSALRKNHESSVIIRSSEVAKVFAQSFKAIER